MEELESITDKLWKVLGDDRFRSGFETAIAGVGLYGIISNLDRPQTAALYGLCTLTMVYSAYNSYK